jgi:hypothetical protein
MRHRNIDPDVSSHRGRVASLSKTALPDDPRIVEAKADLTEAKIKDFVRRTVAAAPPLSVERRTRIVAMILTGGSE